MSTELPPGKSFANYDDAHVVHVPPGRTTVTGMQPRQFAADEIASLPCVTLGAAILNVGPGVEDGQIVESVAPPWLAFIEMFKRNPESIYGLDPRQWEEMIAGAYVADGYDEVILTPRSGDGGRDVIATKKGFCSIRIFDQVKAYRPGHVVTADEVRALAGTLTGFNNVSKGFVTTTSTFAPKIGEDPIAYVAGHLLTFYLPGRSHPFPWTRGFVRSRFAAGRRSVLPLQARAKAGLRSRFQPDEGLSMTANLGGWLAHVAIRASQAMLALCLAGGSTIALADGSRSTMLSLGDSVVFGYITQDGPAYVNADNFIGYPEIVGNALRLDTANPSCPGETTAGFLSGVGADNGCRLFRSRFPLHESYGSTQLDFALAYLGANKRKTRLVTLSLGANDGFLLIAACNNNPTCIQANLPATLGVVYANLNTILSNLRATGFKGVLVVVNYFSTDYSDAGGTALTAALNQTLAAVAEANGAVVADAFTAFQQAAAAAGGKTCFAGLLNANPANQLACDVHPSITGQRLLAKTVQAAYRVVRRSDD